MNRINPNYVTISRLVVFAPLACILLSSGRPEMALLAMIFGELTDFLDGFIARRTNQISDVGKLLDPLCDSVFHMTIWMTFLSIGWVPLWAAVLFFARDSVVSTIRSCLAKQGIALAARWSGKLKAGFQAGAQLTIVTSHVFLQGDTLYGIQTTATILAVLMTAWSLVDYSWCFYGYAREKKIIFAQSAKV